MSLAWPVDRYDCRSQVRHRCPCEIRDAVVAITTIGKLPSLLYRIARILGDISVVWRSTVGRRIGRRIAGRHTGWKLTRHFR